MLTFDHIAVACEKLEQGVDWVEQSLGVSLSPGGQHLRYGTHNMLLGMGDIYLEVIAPDPDAAPFEGPRWFGLDTFQGPPRLANWICQTADFDPVAGRPVALTRGDLNWEMTVPPDGGLPYDGAYPTLVKWATGSAHPVTRLRDSNCRLTEFNVQHPDADTIAKMIVLPDPRVRFVTGAQGFTAQFDTPNGPRHLS